MLVHNFVTQHQIFIVGAAEIFLGANQLSSETVGAAPETIFFLTHNHGGPSPQGGLIPKNEYTMKLK